MSILLSLWWGPPKFVELVGARGSCPICPMVNPALCHPEYVLQLKVDYYLYVH